jgi:hypothetical protein
MPIKQMFLITQPPLSGFRSDPRNFNVLSIANKTDAVLLLQVGSPGPVSHPAALVNMVAKRPHRSNPFEK